MFGKSKRQIINVTFVQPIKGEPYFYAPIAYATNIRNSKGKEGKQVFTDSYLALAGKLKLIFERESMSWFEIKEETSTTSLKDERFFALYYYPHRLVARRSPPFEEKASLQDIQGLFDFLVNEDQIRFAKVRRTFCNSAYWSIEEDEYEETDTISMETEELESEAMSILARRAKH